MNNCKCGRPTKDDAYVCENELDDLARALGEVTWLDEELETTITKQRASTSGDGGRSAETPILFNVAASQARDNLRHELALLVRFCAEEGVRASDPAEGLPDNNIIAMSRWLLWRVDGLAFNDMAEEFIASVTGVVARCKQVIDRPPDSWFAGPCNAELAEGVLCGRDMYATRSSGSVECRGCGSSYDVGARREWLLTAAEDQLADAATLSRSLSWLGGQEVNAARIRKWAERGRILAKGHAPDGRALYRVGDALDLLTDRTVA